VSSGTDSSELVSWFASWESLRSIDLLGSSKRVFHFPENVEHRIGTERPASL
jgi:hypothetical protein